MNHIVTEGSVEIVISDLKLPDGSGLQILWALKKISPDAAFILITAHASVETAIEAVNEGAFAYHVKPLDIDALKGSVHNSLTQQRLSVENRSLLESLQRANQELEEKNVELEQASVAKTQILSTVTHELNTPLTSIMCYVDRLLLGRENVGPLTGRQQRYLEAVHGSADRLKALIDDLLDTSRIESGTLVLAHIEIGVREEIEDAIESMREHINEKDMRVVLDIPKNLRVLGDRLRFSQVMSNLLSNACKYSPKGATTTVTAKEYGGSVQIDVSDRGIGIPRADQPRLFTKFFRADSSSTREVSGTGLGLFIARRLVEAQEGEIWAESEEGKGSTFSFTLPSADGSTIRDDKPVQTGLGLTVDALNSANPR